MTFQTLIEDLTALPPAGASLLDEANAVVDAVLLMRRAHRSKSANTVERDAECFPQTLAVVRLAVAHVVQWHVEGRVLLNGDRTVVFR